MATVEQGTHELVAGDVLSREEFLRRWEAMPHLKKAELIGGVVYMPSPLSRNHGTWNSHFATLLDYYAGYTPGCETGTNATWYMLKDAPQPDVHLAILPEFGGAFRMAGKFCQGAPELAAEISLSSASYDLHQKMGLYEAAGVQEYVTVLLNEREVRWHRLEDGRYHRMAAATDGILRSVVFPGLWLHGSAFLAGHIPQILATLQQGLDSPEHVAFVADLAARRR